MDHRRGYKLETKQAVAMATNLASFIFFSDKVEEYFGLLIGRHVSVNVVAATSRVAAQRPERSRRREFRVCYVTTSSANVFSFCHHLHK